MATNEYLTFAEGGNPSISSYDEWKDDAARENGFTSGIAKSKPVNRILKQGACAAKAIADIIVDKTGKDALLNSESMQEGLEAVFAQFLKSVNGVTPDADGGATISPLLAYPVGSIYMSVVSTSPATLFGGTWEALDQGRVLIGAGSAHRAGETGGAETVTLTENQIPSHTHSASETAAGSHSHTRGSMNITGSLPVNQNQIFDPSGAFTRTSGESYTHTNSTTSEGTRAVGFNAANSWSGSTSSEGSHSHSVTVNATGGGAAHSNMQPYLSVYMWKRTA